MSIIKASCTFRKLIVAVPVTETLFITILQSIVNVVSGIYTVTLCIIIYIVYCIIIGGSPMIAPSAVDPEVES